MSKIIVASKMDDERADFYKSFNGMAAKFGTSVCPIVIPIITDGKVVAYYNMITEKHLLTAAQRQPRLNSAMMTLQDLMP